MGGVTVGAVSTMVERERMRCFSPKRIRSARRRRLWTALGVERTRNGADRRVEGTRISKDNKFSPLLGRGPRRGYYTRKTTEVSTEWASFYNGMDDDWKQYL